jgi:hypothetical protein
VVDVVNIGLVSGGRKEMKMYSLEKGAISKYGIRKNKRDHIIHVFHNYCSHCSTAFENFTKIEESILERK